ncbi:MAG: phosphonopyruvate decarboxylase [Synoicihabitans sp.]
MIPAEHLYRALNDQGIEFYAGVPDSLLKDFCSYVTDHHPSHRHIIAAHEGGAVALAAGYHLATNTIPAVYLQNSGIGNTINPLVSLVDPAVYRIPLLLIIGWRGEIADNGSQLPDEPQHRQQGRITLPLLSATGITCRIIGAQSKSVDAEVADLLSIARKTGGPVALIVRKNTFENYTLQRKNPVPSTLTLTREDAIAHVASTLSPDTLIVATTGKISRELFAYRTLSGTSHERDFLMCGSMGHASQIAAGIALANPPRPVVCLDGDGAALMQLGGFSTSALRPNLTHIVLNNGCHDSVGGQPTRGFEVDFAAIARAMGYSRFARAHNRAEIDQALAPLDVSGSTATFLEIRILPGSRANLGRPTLSPLEMKSRFMQSMIPTKS